MKTIKTPHRPIGLKIFLFTALIGSITMGLTLPANARSPFVEITETKFSVLETNEAKMEELEKVFKTKATKVQETEVIVEKVVEETESIKAQKTEIENEVASLKAEIEEMNDMFVHVNRYAPNASGNTYAAGNCTWYVKQKRPDIGNLWGNANSWYNSAASQGWNVGTKAKIGAIATTGAGWAGHVAYVEKVSRDGQWVTISEMNYGGLYNMNTRTVHFSEFKYIYELS